MIGCVQISNTLLLLSYPFYLLLFLYFATTSVDSYHILVLLFKFKITHFVALILFCTIIPLFRSLYFPYRYTLLILTLMGAMSLSAFNSINPIACAGYFLWMLFNFVFYFSIPYLLFHHIPSHTLFQLYFGSFFLVGFYAFLQFAFSFVGIHLPGAAQHILHVSRGQAFTYEPSFYALYMTPFTIFYTTYFLLNKQNHKKPSLSILIWPNLLLLISTSTGCFFSYLFYFAHLTILNALKIIQINLVKVFKTTIATLIVILGLLASINAKIITGGLLKFFFHGSLHFSLTCRWQGIVDYWKIFLEHPILGVGLGAGPFYYAQRFTNHPFHSLDPEIIATYSPSNVLTEVFASLGLLGVICFAFFFFLLIDTFYKSYRVSQISQEEKIWLIALLLSVGVMFATLQFNQTITRPYVWVHVGMFVGYADQLRRKHLEPK
jgi:hypothetical protein